MGKKFNLWDALAWVVLAGIFVWLVLKSFGVINTPIFLEYAPLFGAVYLAGWAMKKLDGAVEDIKELKFFRNETVKEINGLKTNCVINHGRK